MELHSLLRRLFSLLLISFAFATPTDPYLFSRSAGCVTQDISTFKAVVKYQSYFCKYWQASSARGRSPFTNLSAAQVTNICACILGQQTKRAVSDDLDQNIPTDHGKRAANSCTVAGNAKLKTDFSETVSFCAFYNAYHRTASPFPDFTAAQLIQQCNCVLAPSSTSKAARTTTRTTAKTISTSHRIVSTATPTAAFCSSHNTATLLPVANPTVNRNALQNLKPTTTAVLDYAQASPGVNAASVDYTMLYPQVTLENSAFVKSVICGSGFLTMTLAKDKGSVAIVDQWPQKGLVLITDSSTCNSATQRGVYLVNGWINDAESLSYTYNVKATTWQQVALNMTIGYGTLKNGSLAQTASKCPTAFPHNSTTAATTTRSSTTVSTTTTTTAPFVTPTSFDDLSPDAKQLVLLLLYKQQHNPDGSIKLLQVTNGTNITSIPVTPWSPNNATLQAALQKQLDDAGLPIPQDLVQAAQNGLDGLCAAPSQPSNNTVSNSTTSSHKTLRRVLFERDDGDDTFEEYACNDYVEAVFGDYDDAVCGTYDLIANRQAIACMFTGCYEQQSNPPPPLYTYSFSQDWTATFGLPADSDVVTWSDGSKLTCISCQLALNQFEISGTISATLSPPQLKGATVTFTENSETDMLFQLDAKNPIAYNWNSSLSSGPEQSITVESVFTLTPNVVFSMGVDISADSAVSLQGGASMNVNNGQTTIDMSTLATSNTQNWAPIVQQTYPTFNVSASVQLIPYIRRLITVDVNILGQPSTSIALGSVSSLGYHSEFLEADGEVCVANQLQLKSNIFNTNSIIFGDNLYSDTLNNLTQSNPDQCFNVPSNNPTMAEIEELRSVAQEFCTAYNDYVEPTSGLFLVSTLTTISTASATTTSTVQLIPTVTATTSITTGKVRTLYSTAMVTASAGDESLDSTYLQKRNAVHPSTAAPQVTASARLKARDISVPTLVSGWPASKISFACSQVATGTSTATFYTSTSTTWSATVTSTSTIYTAFQGPASTTTSTLTSYAWSTSTSVIAQKTIPASCPLQTQVSCFTVTGHGSNIEGLYLNLEPGVINPSFNQNPTVFYLSCEGQLTALPDLRVLGGPGGASKVSFNPWGLRNAALCTRDSKNGELNCMLDGSNLMYAWTPTAAEEYWVESNLLYVSPRNDASLWIPTWGFQNAAAQYSLVTLSTQSVTCPCDLDTTTEALASVDATVPSCPASDGTYYTTSDGNGWQVQCVTNYNDPAKSTTSAPSLIACLELCDQNLQCTGATWDSSSNTCVLKASMLSDSYPTGQTIHSVIRLVNPPTCPSSGSQLIVNGGFENGMQNWVAEVLPNANNESPSQYGIRNQGDNSANSYEVTLSGSLAELELTYVANGGQGVYVVGGVPYTISANWMTDQDAESSIECSIGEYGYLDMIPGNGPVNSWRTQTSTFTPATNGYVTINCAYVGTAGQHFWLDNISINC